MKNFKYFIPFSVLLIISCSGEKEIIRDVDYYLKNTTERKKKIIFCKESVSNKSLNCTNAMEAKSRIAAKNILGSGFKRAKDN